MRDCKDMKHVVVCFAGSGSWLATRQLSDRGSSTYPMFDMLECGPTWDHTAGGAMLLVVASSLDAKLVKETCGQVQVMFDKTQVWQDMRKTQACFVHLCQHALLFMSRKPLFHELPDKLWF